MTAVAVILCALGFTAGWVALGFYFISVDALERERRQQARRDEYALAMRRISHRGRA